MIDGKNGRYKINFAFVISFSLIFKAFLLNLRPKSRYFSSDFFHLVLLLPGPPLTLSLLHLNYSHFFMFLSPHPPPLFHL